MAADTPFNVEPRSSDTDIPITGIVQFVKTAYTGAGTQREVQLQITLTADTGFGSPVYDTGLRAPDNRWIMADVVDVPVEMIPLLPLTTYRWRVAVRNTSGEQSSWSTATTFTTAAARMTQALARAAA